MDRDVWPCVWGEVVEHVLLIRSFGPLENTFGHDFVSENFIILLTCINSNSGT